MTPETPARDRRRLAARQFIMTGQVIAYLVAVFGVARLVWTPVRLILGARSTSSDPARVVFAIAFLAIGVASVNYLMARFGHSKLAWAGWPRAGSSVSWFGTGVLVGVGMASSMIAMTMVLGGASLAVEGQAIREYLVRIATLLFAMMVATLGEEWLFRGYPLLKLSNAWGRGWANGLIALLFVAFHWGASGWNLLIGCNIFLGSLVVGALRFTPGGIPAAWGFHFAWNSVQLTLGSTLSGDEYRVPMVRLVTQGPDWITGGSFGPEGGVGATISTVIVLLLLGRYFRRRNVDDIPIPLPHRRVGEQNEQHRGECRSHNRR